jgi:hypothetical protein
MKANESEAANPHPKKRDLHVASTLKFKQSERRARLKEGEGNWRTRPPMGL